MLKYIFLYKIINHQNHNNNYHNKNNKSYDIITKFKFIYSVIIDSVCDDN